MSSSFFKLILSMSLCLMLFSCSNTKENTLPDLEIKCGVAKLSGKITNLHPKGREDNRTLKLVVPHPVNAEVFSYEATTSVDEYGAFVFEVPIQCNYAIGYFRPEKTYEGFYVGLTSGKETNLDIVYERQGLFKITNQTDSLGLTATDLINMEIICDKLINTRPPGITGYAKTSDEFVQRAKFSLNYKLKMIAENDTLSEIAKNYIANNMKLYILNWALLKYIENMQINYLNAGNENLENFNYQEPDKKYYAFLKDFDLNNPQYLYQDNYPRMLQNILSNKTLNIPPIGDMPIEQWMKKVRKILSKQVGFYKGLFYDMLAANSYARQFDDELRPLSAAQIENINHYFKGEKEEIAKILWKKNEEIIPFAAKKEALVVNAPPTVSKEQLLDAIISKYKGKVIVVDFWATWCAPCLDAMTKYRTIKGELKGKEVVFVYFTNSSSPQKLWEEKIKGIGGEHYYLNNDEWIHLMGNFGFGGIPSYVIFDTKGKVRHQFTGYPGNGKMQAMIEKLLP